MLRLKKNLTQFLSLAGLTVEYFEKLLSYFSEDWDNYSWYYIINGTPRIRIAQIHVCK
ncbi:MAG TPA: hypothetical protein PK296_04940 [Paludibacteraceae bacterium]|nr:hypothetical protein [Paludibacteraceae bacterium]HOV83467.1 hypothetical protein [Paludibacteraceae bacterium]